MAGREVRLSVAPEVSELGVVATCLVVGKVRNRASDPDFERYRQELCERLREEYTEDFVRNDPLLEGFRELRRRIGRSNRRYPCSTESLIGYLRRTGTIPSINLAVDIYNCVSLETLLTLGGHDIARIDGQVTLRFPRGDERFVPLGSAEPQAVSAGEYCYIDDNDNVLCRLDYKQGDETKITLQTTDCFYIIQGNPNTTSEGLCRAKARLLELAEKYCVEA